MTSAKLMEFSKERVVVVCVQTYKIRELSNWTSIWDKLSQSRVDGGVEIGSPYSMSGADLKR